jgi:hypothetical protein
MTPPPAAQHASGLSLTEFEQLFEAVKNWGRWGPDDDRGALNYITPARTRAAMALVRSGQTVSLSAPLDTVAGPDNPRPVLHFMTGVASASTHQPRFNGDFVGVECHGDAHSHIDALNHCVYRDRLFNDIPASAVTSSGGPRGAITVAAAGIVSRGVLLDIRRLRGVDWLEPGDIVYPRGARGSGACFRRPVGGRRHRAPADRALRASAGAWALAGRGPESRPASARDAVAARPRDCRGRLHFLDSLNLEDVTTVCAAEQRWAFACVIAPLRLVGGAGTVVNPIAIF